MIEEKKEYRITLCISLILAAFLYVADFLSKSLVEEFFSTGKQITLIPHLLEFNYTHNYGAAFGMLQHQRELFILLTSVLLAVGIVLLLIGKIRKPLCIWAFSLIISGGLGNLTDRLFHEGGYVVDFLCFPFKWFPYIFNLADVCVVIGGALLILYLILDLLQSGGKGKKDGIPLNPVESMTDEEFFSSGDEQ